MPITTADIDKYRSDATTAQQNAITATSNAGKVEGELKSSLQNVLKENTPLIESRNAAQAAYLAAPANARANYADPESENFVFNPYQRQKLITNEQSLAYQPYANLTDYLGLSMGTINDLAQQGAANYNSMAQNQLGMANLAQNQYTNALNEYLQMQELDLARQQESRLGAESKDSDYMTQLLQYLGLGGQEAGGSSSYGESPNYSPMSNGERVANDDGVVWEFQDTKWIPVGRI